MNSNFFETKSHAALVLILLVLAYALLMFGNGLVSLTHPDEVFYIQSAKEMVQYNHWWTPMIFDEIHFEKPIFSFWLFALGVKFFGLKPFVARFWPSFFGILGVLVTYWMAWMLFQRKRLAFIAGVITLSSFIYLSLSRAVLTDMIFTFWVTLAIALFYWGYSNPDNKSKGLIACGIICGIAVLTKGLLGILFPAAVVLIFLIWKRDLAFLKCNAVVFSFLLFSIIAVPWHIVMYKWYGQFFIDEYFHNVHVRRLFEAEHPKADTWNFYLGLMFAGVFPWTLFHFPAWGNVVRHFKQKTQEKDKLIFLISWILGVYVLVQPAHSKLASYVFPAFPALYIILALYLDRALGDAERGDSIKHLKLCGYIMSVVVLGIAIGGIIAGYIYIDYVVSIKRIYVTAAFMGLTALLIFLFNFKARYTRMLFSFLGVNFTLLILLLLCRPYIEPWVSCKDISEVFKKIDHSGAPVLAAKFYVRGIRFYTDRKMAVIDINDKGFFSPHPIPFLNTERKLVNFLKERPVTYGVLKEGNLHDLNRILPKDEFSYEQLENIGGKYIVKIKRRFNHEI